MAPDGTGDPADALVTAYTTVATEAEAKALARALLDERLVACVNLLPMQSLYHWEGRREEHPEIGMLLKTTHARLATLRDRLPALHPYEVPCLEVYPVSEAHPPFAAWVRDETTPA